MSSIIILMGVLSVWHWFYESFLILELRDVLRYKLTKLKGLVAKHPPELSEQEAQWLNDAMLKITRFEEHITFSLLYDVLHENPTSNNQQKEPDCTSPKAQYLRNEINSVLLELLLVNSGGLAIYILPILLVAVMLKKLTQATATLMNIPLPELVKYLH